MKCIPTTCSGREVAAPILVIEIEEVLEARMVPGGAIPSSLAKISRLSDSTSGTASTTSSALPAASSSVAVSMRPRAASRSPAVSTPFATCRLRLRPIVARAPSSAAPLESMRATWAPPTAKTWAIPLPIVPAPTTATRTKLSGALPKPSQEPLAGSPPTR